MLINLSKNDGTKIFSNIRNSKGKETTDIQLASK